MSTGWILLVDDIPDHMRVYEAAFRTRGFQVRLVTTGADALSLLTAARPGCVVIDVRLPDITGWELCRRLKADKRLAKIPVVMLADDTSRQSVDASRTAGCASWLMRPGSPDDIIRAVEHVLADGSSHPEAGQAVIGARHCPACESDNVRAGVRIGPIQYFMCKACNMRWRIDVEGEATA